MPQIRNSAFTEVWVSEHIKSFGNYTFWTNYELEKLVIFCNSVPSVANSGNNGFTKSIIKIYVPDDDLDVYKAISAWRNFIDNIRPLSTYPN